MKNNRSSLSLLSAQPTSFFTHILHPRRPVVKKSLVLPTTVKHKIINGNAAFMIVAGPGPAAAARLPFGHDPIP
jgi:hypothetical protein